MSHFEKTTVVCPHCDHEFSTDDMCNATADDSLWDIAPSENRTDVKCVRCREDFAVRGGYRPHWTTAKTHDELDYL